MISAFMTVKSTSFKLGTNFGTVQVNNDTKQSPRSITKVKSRFKIIDADIVVLVYDMSN